MNALYAFVAIAVLYVIVYVGAGRAGLESMFGVIIPYAAMALFLVGIIYRILKWARCPVPFRITTTCGQQKSLDFCNNSKFDNPHNLWGTVARMALEVLCFRSLFKNTKAEVRDDQKIVHSSDKWLWAAALVFHWSFLVVLLRHFRFFMEPAPAFVGVIQTLDGFFQIGMPILYLTSIALLAGVTYLFLRRVFIPQVRYISLAADYFPLFLIIGIAVSGILMRHFYKVDIVNVKELTMGLVSFHPVVPEGIGFIFFCHLFFVCVLLAYIPFSKLMHLGGVFLSPTRNLANNNRAKRHINPWNYDVKTHTYAEYEDEFRDVMRAAGLPLEKDE